jgi:hypothetical protein
MGSDRVVGSATSLSRNRCPQRRSVRPRHANESSTRSPASQPHLTPRHFFRADAYALPGAARARWKVKPVVGPIPSLTAAEYMTGIESWDRVTRLLEYGTGRFGPHHVPYVIRPRTRRGVLRSGRAGRGAGCSPGACSTRASTRSGRWQRARRSRKSSCCRCFSRTCRSGGRCGVDRAAGERAPLRRRRVGS